MRRTLALAVVAVLESVARADPPEPRVPATPAAQAEVRALEVERVDEAASQAAGREVRTRTRPYAHPHFWAAWVLWGDPN